MTFAFHRPPLAHQLRDFERFKDADYFALWYEMRCGKTKVVLDVFRYRYERGDVDALIDIAFPNGVHRVLIDELEKDFPPDFRMKTRAVAWASGKMATGARRLEALALREHAGPAVLTMNCEALITKTGWEYLEWFIRRRRCMVVADESAWASGWSARTKKLLALGRRPNAVVRAVLDGTPTDEGPVEVYHPCQFLKPGALGYTNKMSFKARYLAYEEEEDPENPGVFRRVRRERHDPATGKVVNTYEVVTGYRNLDELRAKLATFGSRVVRADVSDAPEKVYQTRYFQLTDAQRRVYEDLRGQYVAEIAGGEVRAAEVLKRMTRLQMVARNYWPPEREGRVCVACDGDGYDAEGAECPRCGGIGIAVEVTALRRIDDRSPALEALTQEARATRGPMLVWTRFRQDAADAVAALRQLGRETYRYDGSVSPEVCEQSYQAFRAGNGDAIVGTIGSGLSRGKDLTRATTIVFYSNDFALRSRRQAEDRAEGLSRMIGTGIVDLVAEDTRDLDVINALREKRSIAATIMGDRDVAWI